MRSLSDKKGYKIRKILYSDVDNKIVQTSLETLEKEENKHITKYYRNVYG
jgi:5S rRNA maturation endonuclease (ribonuclease M5)